MIKPRSSVRKKLVLVTDKYPFPVGGIESHAYEFRNFFVKRKEVNFVATIAFSNKVTKTTYYESKGKEVLIVIPEEDIYDGSLFLQELNKMSIGDGDILFFNSLYWIRIFPKLKQVLPNTKFVLRSGGNDIMQSQIVNKGKTLAKRRAYVVNIINRYIDSLIVNSKFSFNRFKDLGILTKKMIIISGGVDTVRFHPVSKKDKLIYRKKLGLPDNTIILASARVVPVKGFLTVMDAISRVRGDISYVILGDGPEKEKILKKIKDLGLENKVILVGALAFEKVHYYFAAADLYCYTPINVLTKVEGGSYIHTETMGRSFCEALSSGLPVVTTNVGGVKDVVLQGKTGFLAEENDMNSITRYLNLLVGDLKKRNQLSRRGREEALRKFSWAVFFSNYLNLFKK